MREHWRAVHAPFQCAAQKYGERHNKVFIMKIASRDFFHFFHSVQLQPKKRTATEI